MNSSILKLLVQKALGSIIRHGFTAAGVWLFNHGLPAIDQGTQANITDILIGAVMIGFGLLWSVIKSHTAQKQIDDLVTRAAGLGMFTLRRDEGKPPTVPPAALGLLVAFMGAALSGCAVMSNFDQNSYVAASVLKSEALSLISNALDPAADHQEEISSLKVKLSAQLAYEEGKGKKNVISATQWRVLVSPERDLLGKLLLDWENGKEFSAPYLIEKGQQISDAFDQIIKLEGGKLK